MSFGMTLAVSTVSEFMANDPQSVTAAENIPLAVHVSAEQPNYLKVRPLDWDSPVTTPRAL